MRGEKLSQNRNMKLMKIIMLREHLEELYNQSGSNSSKYITISLELRLLEREYVEERISEVLK